MHQHLFRAGACWSDGRGGCLELDVIDHIEEDGGSAARESRPTQDIHLSFTHGTQAWIALLDWATLSLIIAAFPQLKRVVVFIEEGSAERTAYAKYAQDHLEPVLRGSGVQLEMHNSFLSWAGFYSAQPSTAHWQTQATSGRRTPVIEYVSTNFCNERPLTFLQSISFHKRMS